MKFAVKLFTAFLIAVLTASLLAIFTPAATSDAVIYISANGTGDGSSPTKPLGNASGYKIESGTDNKLALYRALDKLKTSGGTIVIVGPVVQDTAHSRVPKDRTDVQVISECRTPTVSSSVAKKIRVKITSIYNGVDYRTKGAKLILDHAACNTGSIAFNCPMIFEGLNIEYKYDSSFMNSYGATYLIEGYGNALEIGSDVNVTSFDVFKNAEGDRYPCLIGGHRYANITNKGTNLTVNSGTWELVCGGSYGLNESYGTVSGDINLTINGGKIGMVTGTSSLVRPYGKYTGAVNITVNGGDIGELFFVSTLEYTAKLSTVFIGKDANIAYMDYAPINYSGNYVSLITLFKVKNENVAIPGQLTPPDDSDDNVDSQNNEQPKRTGDILIVTAIVVTLTALSFFAAHLRKKFY